jgi:hypothetical protein
MTNAVKVAALGGAPTFWAWQNASAQTYTGTPSPLKLTCDAAEWNVGSCYNTSTSTFTPTVAGYYMCVGSVGWAGGAIGITNSNIYFYKNGANYTDIRMFLPSGAGNPIITGSSLIYMNGTTDYLNLYFDEGGVGTATTANSQDRTYFGAFLAKAA